MAWFLGSSIGKAFEASGELGAWTHDASHQFEYLFLSYQFLQVFWMLHVIDLIDMWIMWLLGFDQPDNYIYILSMRDIRTLQRSHYHRDRDVRLQRSATKVEKAKHKKRQEKKMQKRRAKGIPDPVFYRTA